jgi:hypothetical protein
MPPAIFLVFAWRPVSRAVPTAGTGCFLVIVTLALAGWLVPLSSELFNNVLRQTLGSVALDPAAAPPLSHSEGMLAVTGWASLAGAAAICAALVAKRAPLMSRWWLAGVPAIYAALTAVFTVVLGASFLVFRAVGDPPEGFSPGIAAWTTAALVMAVSKMYRRPAVHTAESPASID